MIDNVEMERVNRIINNSIFKHFYALIEEYEKNRIYCKHDMGHLLDVARLAWIFNLEEKLGISREIIYATAILHDIGKHEQYVNKTPHEIAAIPIANSILCDCDFDESEREIILSAIKTHRDENQMKCRDLNRILYRADKMCRNCFNCDARASCHWTLEKMNLEIKY